MTAQDPLSNRPQAQASADGQTPDELEALIAELPVRRPTEALDQRVFRGLTPPVYALPWVNRAAAFAAVILLGLGAGLWIANLSRGNQPGGARLAQNDVSETAPPLRMPVTADEEPARIEQVWVASEPTGRIVVTDGSAMEELRVTEVRHVQFTDDGASYEVAVPVQRVTYRPAHFD